MVKRYAQGKRQEARGKRQEARGKSLLQKPFINVKCHKGVAILAILLVVNFYRTTKAVGHATRSLLAWPFGQGQSLKQVYSVNYNYLYL